jgi:hypothetical protein
MRKTRRRRKRRRRKMPFLNTDLFKFNMVHTCAQQTDR